MKFTKSFLIFALSFSLVSVSFLSFTTQTIYAQQDSRIALQRGYRTGYSDGYMSGYRDAIESQTKNYGRHGEYAKADRAFSKEYGAIEDYRDGYQQGFESGYNTGFEKRSFDATIPANLNKRGVVAVNTTTEEIPAQTTTENVAAAPVQQPPVTNKVEETPSDTIVTTTDTVEQSPVTTTPTNADTIEQPPTMTSRTENVNSIISGETIISIPQDTELIVELLESINTDRNREGDRFQARIISPNELNGAIIEGRISKIQKPGRIKRRAEMLLSFDRVVLSQNRWSNFSAILTEVLPRKGDNVRRVDTEGTVEGKSSVKSDSIKIGATTGTGLVIGAIAGGPVGAAVGAGVGAAFGVGAVVVERGKHINLDKDQQLRIKSSYETQIR
jgi:hypothetical protein